MFQNVNDNIIFKETFFQESDEMVSKKIQSALFEPLSGCHRNNLKWLFQFFNSQFHLLFALPCTFVFHGKELTSK